MATTHVSDDPVIYHDKQNVKEFLSSSSKKISDEDRMILKMRIENYSYAEIACKLGINVKRVDNRLARLKKKYLDRN